MRHLTTVLLLLSLLAFQPQAAAAPTHWVLAGSGRGYQLQASGNPARSVGARMTLQSSDADARRFGTSVMTIDAVPYRNRTVRISADLTTREAPRGATLWLRADGPRGMLAFANSGRMRVLGDAGPSHRDVDLTVPAGAVRLAFGVVLDGRGKVRADALRLTTIATPPAVPPMTVLDVAIRLVRTHALRAATVDWNQLVPQLHASAAHATVARDVYPLIRTMLHQLGDHHSFLLPPEAQRQDLGEGGPTSVAAVGLRQGDIGYINMPGYRGVNRQARSAFVDNMLRSIARDAPVARCGWVVDLRQDTGGSMLPMLASLRPLLGAGALGGFRGVDGRVEHVKAWYPIDGAMPPMPALEHAPVAVLIGPHTSSSGEITAIAFRGRPDTRSFGLPSDGRSTGNTVFPLPDGSGLVLTTAVDVDRRGQAYGGKLLPDQPAAAGAGGAAGVDAALAAATAWLSGRSTCHDAGRSGALPQRSAP